MNPKMKKPKTRIITGCNDCPFFRRRRSGIPFCKIDESVKVYNSDKMNGLELIPITPENCPLKTQPIIVTYES